jgi:hypothetical protein
VKRGLMVEVPALPADMLMGFGEQLHRPLATITAPLAPRHPPLAPQQISLSLAVAARVVDHRVVCEGGKGL